jgi:hypothetical protein
MSAKDDGLPTAPSDVALSPSPVAIDFFLECDMIEISFTSLAVKKHKESEVKRFYSNSSLSRRALE